MAVSSGAAEMVFGFAGMVRGLCSFRSGLGAGLASVRASASSSVGVRGGLGGFGPVGAGGVVVASGDTNGIPSEGKTFKFSYEKENYEIRIRPVTGFVNVIKNEK